MQEREEANTQLHTVLEKGRLASTFNHSIGLFDIVSLIGIE